MPTDDWRIETQRQLDDSILYRRLKQLCKKDPGGSHLLSLVDDGVYYAYQRTKLVLRHMKEFTLHDGEHLFRVVYHMHRLLEKSAVDALSPPELLFWILSSFFHDIGMAPSEHEVELWFRQLRGSQLNGAELAACSGFVAFCKSRPSQLAQISALRSSARHHDAIVCEQYLVSEYIRQTHAARTREI